MNTHYLGIDWGKKKIGLALADNETRIAFALGVIVNDDDVMHTMAQKIAEHNVSHIIVGVPQHKNIADSASVAEKFGKDVARENGVEVVFVDEMFSTKMAQQERREAGKKDLSADDADAARIMLEEWLNQAI